MGKNTYVAVGNKEDISDLIQNIAPEDTPLYSTLGKGPSATATYHEWLEDDLGDPADNAKKEGFTYTVDDPTTRTRLGNYTQIMSRGYGVTDTQEVVQKHGLTSEISYQMTKAMKELAFDVEKALIEQDAKVAGDAATARRFGALPYWIQTNVLHGVDTGGGVYTPRAFTEELVNDALEAAWSEGGKPSIIMMSGKNKRRASKWTNGSTKNMDATETKLQSRIDVYESDFGMVKLMMNRWMPHDTAFVIDPSLWKVCFLRPFATKDLPKTGDTINKIIVGELTLEARAQNANAVILDIDPAIDPV